MEQSEEAKPGRRAFLLMSTAGFAAAALGLGAWGLTRALSPSADVFEERWWTTVDLNDLSPGKPVIIRDVRKPVFVLKMTPKQAAMAGQVATDATPDIYARNENLLPDAKATLENRTFESHERFAVFDARCPRLGCIPLFAAGDYGAWFCPCGASHFDLLGRLRKGIAPTNMLIPRYTVTADAKLLLPVGKAPLSDEELDRMIYGDREGS